MCRKRELHGLRVLLVEPEQQLADILKRGLEELGAKVGVVHTHDDGMAHLAESLWDVCVIGHSLPAIHATCFLEEGHALQPIPYIITSPGDISLMTAIPIAGLLMKPFELSKLTAALKEASK